MFLEAIPLKRGGDSFASAPHGLVDLDQQDSVEVKIANTTKRNILLRSGELVGLLTKAKESLKNSDQVSQAELDQFAARAAQLAALVPTLDEKQPAVSRSPPTAYVEEPPPSESEEVNWGPKTSDPGPDQVYPSEKLREIIDVDPELGTAQQEALYKVIENNQRAFGFDG